MHIAKLTLSNFRCFGTTPTVVPLGQMAAFVGANGSGKTAILQALSRLFGTLQSERTLEASDFHLPKGASRDAMKAGDKLELFIEAEIMFPELDAGNEDKGAIAECFSQMMVTSPGGEPFCRVRLEGTWTKSNLPEGEVEQCLYWMHSAPTSAAVQKKTPMAPHERTEIHVHYIPAARDPSKQIKYVSGTIINRLFRAVTWSTDIDADIEKAADDIHGAFEREPGVQSIESTINSTWKKLHPGGVYDGVKLRPVARRLEDLFRQMQAVFIPGPDGEEQDLERLSDGLKSLFYLAMVCAGFQIETRVAQGDAELSEHFDAAALDSPILTVFAFEEPENHIAPHYLGRIVKLMRELIETGRAQVAITSHSPSVMQRIDPTEVRHVRRDEEKGVALVKSVRLPEDESEAFKYVREAVLAHPELYFARLVILGEGESEEVMLPKIAAARGIEIDLSFVSVVPLGGRHVNHFWRLLNDLSIPHVTLLDLDRERQGGGWGRVQYAVRELLAAGRDSDELLTEEDDQGTQATLDEDDLDSMTDWEVGDEALMDRWIAKLEEFDVYYSAPLDFDFLMLRRFSDVYQDLPEGANGPDIPEDTSTPAGAQAQRGAIRAVLKPQGGDGSTYSDDEKLAFFWYRYLFLGRSKPVSHLRAIAAIDPDDLRRKCPGVLRKLCNRVKELLRAAEAGEENGTES